MGGFFLERTVLLPVKCLVGGKPAAATQKTQRLLGYLLGFFLSETIKLTIFCFCFCFFYPFKTEGKVPPWVVSPMHQECARARIWFFRRLADAEDISLLIPPEETPFPFRFPFSLRNSTFPVPFQIFPHTFFYACNLLHRVGSIQRGVAAATTDNHITSQIGTSRESQIIIYLDRFIPRTVALTSTLRTRYELFLLIVHTLSPSLSSVSLLLVIVG